MNKKELFYFTGKCLMLDEDPGFRKVIIDKIASDSIDFGKFVKLCSNHLILPSIYLKFKSHDILSYLPEDLAEHLKDVHDLNLARNTQILEQLTEVVAILNKNEIFPIFMKGSGNLLDQLYADNGERILGDIDFLVPKKDYLLAPKLLEEVGYAITIPFYQEVDDLKHYPRIAKSGYPTRLEIHQLPVYEKNQSWFNSEMIEQDKKPVALLPGSYVLSNNHNIILNFIHGQLDHEGYLYGIASFRDLYDLYLLSKRTPLTQTINSIKPKGRAIAYFAFVGKAFGLDEKFYPDTNFSSRLYLKKHTLNHRSALFYHTYRSIVYLGQRILINAPKQIMQSFYSKKVRQSVISRLTNRKWYFAHFHSYSEFFIREK